VSALIGETTIAPAAPLPGVGEAVRRLGDVLVTFGMDAAPPARRPGAPFAPVAGGEAWRVWEAPLAADWAGTPVTRVREGRWTAWLLGELYATPRPDEAVRAVLADRAAPDSLNGHYALLAHDAAADEWHVWTNRHATFHVYYAGDGHRAALGTCFRGVAAAARRELDWPALTSFFAFGYFAGDRTFLADARILRPATHTRYDSRGRLLSEQRTWRWWHAPDMARSAAATVDAFADRFQTVMDGVLADGRVAVPISGGLDSRSTVAAIGRDVPADRLWAYSYGYQPDSVETRLAAQVAAARGLPFQSFTIGPYLFDSLPRIMASIEGFQDVTQARQAAVADAIASHSDAVIAAHWGDVYLDDMGVAHAPTPDDALATALYKFRKPGSEWLLENVSRAQLGRSAPQAVLRDLLAAELERLGPLADPDFVIKALKTEQWSARWTTASLRMFQSAAFPRLPFYDTRLTDFFCTVPTAYVAGRRLQIEYLKRHAPDLARVPWQATGRDLFSDGGFAPLALAGRAARKAERRLTGRRVIERNWEVQFLGNEGRAALRDWLLRPGRRLHDAVPVAAVRDLLEAFERDPWGTRRGAHPKPAYAVSLLLTLSAWLDSMAGELDE
jgi:asparagine synthase (glutamine-hydrolysing)